MLREKNDYIKIRYFLTFLISSWRHKIQYKISLMRRVWDVAEMCKQYDGEARLVFAITTWESWWRVNFFLKKVSGVQRRGNTSESSESEIWQLLKKNYFAHHPTAEISQRGCQKINQILKLKNELLFLKWSLIIYLISKKFSCNFEFRFFFLHSVNIFRSIFYLAGEPARAETKFLPGWWADEPGRTGRNGLVGLCLLSFLNK